MPQPRYAVAPTLVEARAAADGIGYPLVVKPPDRQGQKGLAVARTPAELDGAFETALGASRGGLALLEELVDGPEVTVNAFSVGGRFVPLTVTDRVVGGAARVRGRARARVAERASGRGCGRGRARRRGGARRDRRPDVHAAPPRAGRARASASSPRASAAVTTPSSAAPRSAST